MNKEFGDLIQKLRKQKGWTAKEFLEKLGTIGENDKLLSPSYITKVEVYGEIPSPEVICRMADVLDYDHEQLIEIAKNTKVNRFEQSLQEKYQQAVGLYRVEREKDDSTK
ncbi:MAG: hypothetical protein A2X78_03085 [Gammaproteobacteria bacterium GWE2_37_16]|nr:MAG: hypothetical protein A2X78_03085 [Gammaproteobacteria bacterium GWE2_37_16]